MIGLVILYSLSLASADKSNRRCGSRNDAYCLSNPFPVVSTGLAITSVSSVWDATMSLDRIRLNYSGNREGSQGWCSALNDGLQWVQVSSQIPLRWDHIVTQGRGDFDNWVSSFIIEYLSGDSWITYNKGQVFFANFDRTTSVDHILEVPLIAYAIRIKPLKWYLHTCMRLEAYVSDDIDFLPKASEFIPAIESGMLVTASSIWDAAYDTSRIRLNFAGNREGAQSWSAASTDLSQWVQVSSFKLRRWVKINTQGRGDVDQYVTSYRILYSPDGLTWFYADNGRVFIGNVNHSQVVTNTFDEPFLAKIVRLEPVTWYGHISLRMEIYYTDSNYPSDIPEKVDIQSFNWIRK
jgi:hypothetical protein